MMYVFQDLLPGESRDLCYALKGFIQGKKAEHESERESGSQNGCRDLTHQDVPFSGALAKYAISCQVTKTGV